MLYTCGNDLLTRKQLHEIPIPERVGVSKNWQGINHGVLADAVVAQCQESNLEIVQEMWYVNPKQTDLFGAVDISNDSQGLPQPEHRVLRLDSEQMRFSLGVRHSNAGKYAVSFCVGARITVCQNGMFSGDFTVKRRHTNTIDLHEITKTGIKRYLSECVDIGEIVRGMNQRRISDEQACHAMMISYRSGLLNFRYLEDVDKLWRHPSHFQFEPRTAWSLYNAFTETAKLLSPPRQLRLLSGLKTLFWGEDSVWK